MNSDTRDRTAYFREYARKNAAKRKANLRRWAAENREHVNAYARTWQNAKRRAKGIAARPRPIPQAKPKPVIITGEGLRERFLSYRKAKA